MTYIRDDLHNDVMVHNASRTDVLVGADEPKYQYIKRLTEANFSAIFQPNLRSSEKAMLKEDLKEMSWCHDHDRLLIDFFSSFGNLHGRRIQAIK